MKYTKTTVIMYAIILIAVLGLGRLIHETSVSIDRTSKTIEEISVELDAIDKIIANRLDEQESLDNLIDGLHDFDDDDEDAACPLPSRQALEEVCAMGAGKFSIKAVDNITYSCDNGVLIEEF